MTIISFVAGAFLQYRGILPFEQTQSICLEESITCLGNSWCRAVPIDISVSEYKLYFHKRVDFDSEF